MIGVVRGNIVDGRQALPDIGIVQRHVDETNADHEAERQHGKCGPAQLRPPKRKRCQGQGGGNGRRRARRGKQPVQYRAIPYRHQPSGASASRHNATPSTTTEAVGPAFSACGATQRGMRVRVGVARPPRQFFAATPDSLCRGRSRCTGSRALGAGCATGAASGGVRTQALPSRPSLKPTSNSAFI
jgi:hypothetical protein